MRFSLYWRGYGSGLVDDSFVMPCQQNLLEICPLALARKPSWYLVLGEAVHFRPLMDSVDYGRGHGGETLGQSVARWMLLTSLPCTSWALGESLTLLQNHQETGGDKGSRWLSDIAACPVLGELGTRKAVDTAGACKASAPNIEDNTLWQCSLLAKLGANWHRKSKYLKGPRSIFTE